MLEARCCVYCSALGIKWGLQTPRQCFLSTNSIPPHGCVLIFRGMIFLLVSVCLCLLSNYLCVKVCSGCRLESGQSVAASCIRQLHTEPPPGHCQLPSPQAPALVAGSPSKTIAAAAGWRQAVGTETCTPGRLSSIINQEI